MEANTPQSQNYKGAALAAWIILGLLCAFAMIPAIGLLTWFFAIPILVITFIIGIVVLSKGGTFQGVLILLASLIVVPAFLMVAPIVMTTVFAAFAVESDLIENMVQEKLESEADEGEKEEPQENTQGDLELQNAPDHELESVGAAGVLPAE